MTPPDPKQDELQRLRALKRYGILDTPPEPDYDDIVHLAAELCGVPIALVSLVDEHRQWFKANVGLPGVTETERDIAFCHHAIQNEDVFVVEDASAHKGFADNPLVRGHPFIRFYAGAPLRTDDGYHIGTLCIIDRNPRELTPSQHSALLRLKRQVEIKLQLRLQLQEAQARNAELQEAKRLVEMHAAYLERQVQESLERTRRLMDCSREAVFVLDETGRVLEVSPAAERLLGPGRPRLVGTAFESLAPEPEREALRQALQTLLTQGTVLQECQLLRGNTGGRVLLELVGSLQEVGSTRRLLLVGHDLTEKRRLEQQSMQSERLASVGALAAGIAHEINNPTAYVLSNLGFLQGWRDELEQELPARSQLPPGMLETLGEAKEAITECLEGARRIRDIVRDMRHFSHTSDLASSPVNIHAALDVVLRMAQGELKHTARLEKHYAPGPLFVLGNEGRLNQVFLNLIINACHAMQPGSLEHHVLRIQTQREGPLVRVDISDTGHGIPPDVLPRIFDPFFTTKPVGKGTGLGLSISHSIIQKMGGEMRVDSQPGRGTTFSLLLPAYTKARSRPELQAAPPA